MHVIDSMTNKNYHEENNSKTYTKKIEVTFGGDTFFIGDFEFRKFK